MAEASDLPILDDVTERSKAIVKYLDANQVHPSGANYNLILLAYVAKYDSRWFSELAQLDRPIIRDPAFDPEDPPSAKDPLGLFEIVYEDDLSKVSSSKKQNLGSRLRIDVIRQRDKLYVADYEARTEPTQANANAETEKRRLAQVGKDKADAIYSSDEGEVPTNRGGTGQGARKP